MMLVPLMKLVPLMNQMMNQMMIVGVGEGGPYRGEGGAYRVGEGGCEWSMLERMPEKEVGSRYSRAGV